MTSSIRLKSEVSSPTLKEIVVTTLVGLIVNPFSLIAIGLFVLWNGFWLSVDFNNWANAQPYSTEFKYITMALFFGGGFLLLAHDCGKRFIQNHNLRTKLGFNKKTTKEATRHSSHD